LPLNLWVQIEEATIGALNVTEVLFVGIAAKCADGGAEGDRKRRAAIDVLGAEAPAFTFQPRCNYRVFGAGCGLNRALYEIPVEIALISVGSPGGGCERAFGADQRQQREWLRDRAGELLGVWLDRTGSGGRLPAGDDFEERCASRCRSAAGRPTKGRGCG
jgi:hypothetical protein